ncbi:MAG TPA: cell wall-binding repeat-containing protein [Acidothermaceae bacterium]|nr:cell wall-binding repeat-containing protein [Acidothermaceae bacterium]
MRESLDSVRRQRRYKVTVGLAVLALGAPLIAASAGATVAAGATGLTVTRVSGADRYATAAAIADAGWPNPLPANSTLLLATGATFPDAVAGAAAAGHLGVPLLLTASGALSSSAAAEIDRLKPTHVALLGGTAALSDAVAQQVATHGATVVRWQGSDRYATAVAVSKATYPSGATNVYLATGTNFPDALAGAALAAVAGGPLLLTDPKTLPSETAAEITRLHPSAIVVLGGTSAVSDQVAAAAVTAAGGAAQSRIQGADRYQTADAVASVLVSVKGGTTAANGILLATGLDFPDALAGAAWAGESDRPLLLAPELYITPQTWSTIQTLAAPSAVILGGTSAIADGVATGLSSGNPPTSPPVPVVGGATDWPTYHHDAQRTGVTTATPAFNGFSAGWKASLDGAVYGQPIVHGTTVVAATEGGSLYGLSLATGAVLWRTHIADPIAKSQLPCGDIDPLGITGTPAYDPSDGLVLSVAETAGGHHILAGVSLATGAIAFQRTLDPLSATAIASQQRGAILVANGRVYVAYGGLAGDCASYIGQVVSVASNGTGTPIGWAVPTTREGGIWAPAGPVEDTDGTILVAAGNGASDTTYDGSDSVTRLSPTLSRLDYFAPSTWANDNDNDLDLGSMSPVLVGGKVLIAGKRGTGYLLNPTHFGGVGGQLSQLTLCKPFGGASVVGSTAYLPCNDGIRAVAVSGNSMSIAWHAASNLTGPPVVASGTLYTTDGSGSVYALNASTGATLGQISVGSLPHFASPSLSGTTLLIGTLSGVTAVRM